MIGESGLGFSVEFRLNFMEFSIDLSRILTFFDIFVRKFEKKRSDLKKKGFELQNGVPPFRFWSYFGTKICQKLEKSPLKKSLKKQPFRKSIFCCNLAFFGRESIAF